MAWPLLITFQLSDELTAQFLCTKHTPTFTIADISANDFSFQLSFNSLFHLIQKWGWPKRTPDISYRALQIYCFHVFFIIKKCTCKYMLFSFILFMIGRFHYAAKKKIPPGKIPLYRVSMPLFFYRQKYTAPPKKDTVTPVPPLSTIPPLTLCRPCPLCRPSSLYRRGHGRQEAPQEDGWGGRGGHGHGRGRGTAPFVPPPAPTVPAVPHTVPLNLLEAHANFAATMVPEIVLCAMRSLLPTMSCGPVVIVIFISMAAKDRHQQIGSI